MFWAVAGALSLQPVDGFSQNTIAAFPGAEGFGMYTTGGRGGAVYHVTKLDDDGSEGTFRWACGQSGKRTVVFDVSGTIFLKSSLRLANGDVTIAGQTAPGDGICIADYPFLIAADNVILRFLRFRCGNRNVAHHEGDGLGSMSCRNIMVDHCSVSWSIDECISVYGSTNFTVQWCIASQSLNNAGHSKGPHAYGGNWGGRGASYHHNFMAHHESREPRLGPSHRTQEDERMDLRNNVFYNWGGFGCYGGEAMKVNIVNNYYKPGPTTKLRPKEIQYRIASPNIRTIEYCLDKKSLAARYTEATGEDCKPGDISATCSKGVSYATIKGKNYVIEHVDSSVSTIVVNGKTVDVTWNVWKKMLHVWGQYYVDGNYNPYWDKVNKDNFKYGVAEQINKKGNDGTYPGDDKIKLTEPIAFQTVTTHSAQDAYERVLTYAGASLHRDALDAVMVSDARNAVVTYTGSNCTPGIINTQDDNKPAGAGADWSPWPQLSTDKSIDVTDTDGDGIPDVWEEANGLDKNNAGDGAALCADGYTNLEHYMNGIVADIMQKGNEGGQSMTQK